MKNKGKIYCGYPCVGKSSITGISIFNKEDKCMHTMVDMETSLMRDCYGDRPDNWVDIYVNYVNDLTEQGINVMCSTHNAVRSELESRGLDYINVFPSLNIKDWWLDRMQDRWEKCPSDKNKAAYDRAMGYYEEDIKDLMQHNKYISIGIERKYDLKDLIEEYEILNVNQWNKN